MLFDDVTRVILLIAPWNKNANLSKSADQDCFVFLGEAHLRRQRTKVSSLIDADRLGARNNSAFVSKTPRGVPCNIKRCKTPADYPESISTRPARRKNLSIGKMCIGGETDASPSPGEQPPSKPYQYRRPFLTLYGNGEKIPKTKFHQNSSYKNK